MNRPQNVTFIDDLPDLDQLEYMDYKSQNNTSNHDSNSFNHPNYNKAYGNPEINIEDPKKYKKFIRNNSYNVPADAGMGFNSSNSMILNKNQNGNNNDQNMYEQPISYPTNNYNNFPSCIQVSEHIRDCPICCKFYKHDNTAHTIIIIVLSIMCLLLLKRVLDI